MQLVSASRKLRDDVAREEFRVAPGNVHVQILHAQVAVEHRLKAVQHLHLVEEQIVHPAVRHLRTDIRHEFFRIRAAPFFLHIEQVFSDLCKIRRGIKGKAHNVIRRHAVRDQILVEQPVQKIRFPAPPDPCDHLDHPVVPPCRQLVQIKIPANLHVIGSHTIDLRI